MKKASKGLSTEGVVVFGFGAQGRAQAQNLRDSGVDVRVYLRRGSPRVPEVREAGIKLITDPTKAAKRASLAVVLIPDGEQANFYKEVLEPSLPKNAALVFAHGFAIHYRHIVPRADLDVVLVAPLAQGNTVRSDYVRGADVPCMIAVDQDATGGAQSRAYDYARAISKMGPFIESTFAEEVVTDLFTEQSVLCGGLPELIRASFDTLVDAGYNADTAYFSCLRELRAIVALLDQHAIAGSRKFISDTARFGALTRGPRIIDDRIRDELKRILEEIRSGSFTDDLVRDREKGYPLSTAKLKQEEEHPIERIHRKFNPINR